MKILIPVAWVWAHLFLAAADVVDYYNGVYRGSKVRKP